MCGRQPLVVVVLSLAVWNFEARGVANFMSGDGVVRIMILEGGQAHSSSISVCC